MRRATVFSRVREGQILVMGVAAIAVLAVFAALTIDVGHLLSTESRLQNAADAASLAATNKLIEERFVGVLEEAARATATQEAAYMVVANAPNARFEIVYGKFEDDVFTPLGIDTPATAAMVTVTRDSAAAGGAVSTFFAPVMGISSVNVASAAIAKMRQGIYAIGSDLRPFGIPKDALTNPLGSIINYTQGQWMPYDGCDDDDGDGIPDVDDDDDDNDGKKDWVDDDINGDGILDAYQEMFTPHGNFGWLDLDGGANSTTELVEWMANGYPELLVIDPDVGYIMINGTPGLRTTLQEDFKDLIGQHIFVCVYDEVTGVGSNAEYRVVAFAGITLTDVRTTGAGLNDYIEFRLDLFSNVPICLVGGDPNSNLYHTSLVE